ncbi:uncharacterized protein LOC100377870 [Saccoglossus kowalevskii]|uniref:Uncharacterized protein LOC100377870 n=1 Tax=Saccoglossus kowalevskii TaxID=10224 RepID=A0ABM0GPH0_SACKO|nr:PREDICTED: uncharacterized protein LOC100377870 [Saccoglossus kowalevskii]
MDKIAVLLLLSFLCSVVESDEPRICTVEECRKEGDAYIMNPVNWDQSGPVLMCNFLKARVDCLTTDPCVPDVNNPHAVNSTSLKAVIEGIIDYYTNFGLCDDTVDESLDECHMARIRQRCLEESARRIKSPYAISCLETARVSYCIYEEQVYCDEEDVYEPESYPQVQYLISGNCRYYHQPTDVLEAARTWRENNPEYFQYRIRHGSETPCSVVESSATCNKNKYIIAIIVPVISVLLLLF